MWSSSASRESSVDGKAMSRRTSAGVLGWLNSRWSFGARLALISGLFCVPVALLLVLFIQASDAQIGFSSKELAGARYLTQVWGAIGGQPGLEADGRFNEQDALAAFGKSASPMERASAGPDLIAAGAHGP